MTIILKRSRFLHIPKTGGTWVRTMLLQSRIDLALSSKDVPHLTLQESPGHSLFTFAFVRNPLSWYPSYWKYKTKVGWNQCKTFDINCQAPTFHQFLDNVIEKSPGYYSKLLPYYVGQPHQPIDFIGKQENLVQDFLTALELAGEYYDSAFADLVRQSKPVNTASQGDQFFDAYPEGYALKIYNLEITTFNRFGYTFSENTTNVA